MVWLVVVGLGALVYYLAQKSPGVQPTTSLSSDTTVPGTGVSEVPSPATSNGSALIATSNRLRLSVSYQYANLNPKVLANSTPRTYWNNRDRVVTNGGYMTDAQASLATQDVPPIVTAAPPGTGGHKI